MNRWYLMINECLAVLMHCDFAPMQRLRIEGRLIHLKKILIRTSSQDQFSKYGFCDADFEALVHQLFEGAQKGYARGDVTNVLDAIARMEVMLNSSQSFNLEAEVKA